MPDPPTGRTQGWRARETRLAPRRRPDVGVAWGAARARTPVAQGLPRGRMVAARQHRFDNLIDFPIADPCAAGKPPPRRAEASTGATPKRVFGKEKIGPAGRGKRIAHGRTRADRGAGPVTPGAEIGVIAMIPTHAAREAAPRRPDDDQTGGACARAAVEGKPGAAVQRAGLRAAHRKGAGKGGTEVGHLHGGRVGQGRDGETRDGAPDRRPVREIDLLACCRLPQRHLGQGQVADSKGADAAGPAEGDIAAGQVDPLGMTRPPRAEAPGGPRHGFPRHRRARPSREEPRGRAWGARAGRNPAQRRPRGALADPAGRRALRRDRGASAGRAAFAAPRNAGRRRGRPGHRTAIRSGPN